MSSQWARAKTKVSARVIAHLLSGCSDTLLTCKKAESELLVNKKDKTNSANVHQVQNVTHAAASPATLKLQLVTFGNQGSCSMRLLRKQLGCPLPSLFFAPAFIRTWALTSGARTYCDWRNYYFYAALRNWILRALTCSKTHEIWQTTQSCDHFNIFHWLRKWAGPNGLLGPPELQPWCPLSRTWWKIGGHMYHTQIYKKSRDTIG